MKRIQFTSDLKIQASGTANKIPTVRMEPAYSGGKLLLRDYDLPVVIDLATCTSDQNIPILIDHFGDRRLGHTTSVKNDGYTVQIEGILSSDNEDVREIVRTSKIGARWEASIGTGLIDPINIRLLPEGEQEEINGQVFSGPIYIVSYIDIREVSIVAVGSDSDTMVTIKASALKNKGDLNMLTFEAWAYQHGFELAGLSDELLAALKLAYETETGLTSTEPAVTVEPVVETVAETEPIVEANTVETVIEEEEEEPKKPTIQASGSRLGRAGNPARRQVNGVDLGRTIEASMLMSNGCRDADLETLGYDNRTIDQATSRSYRGMGLQALCYRTIQAAGLSTSPGVVDNNFIRTAFEASNMLRSRSIRASGAGFSTVNLPGILSNVANKTLLKAYFSAEGVATKLSVTNSSKDFKASYAYTFGLSGELQPVGDGGELQHLAMVEGEFQNRIDTRGAIVACTRQMIINDDLGAFLRIATELGRKAAHSLEKTWWKILFQNISNLFSDDYFNTIADPLNIAGLSEADRLFSEQTGLGGKDDFILSRPAFLVVPPALNVTAKTIYTSATVNETTATGKPSPVDNPFSGEFEPVSSPFFGSRGGLGGTDKNWMLLADPNDVPMMEILYLNGVSTPFIETADVDFNTLGMQTRCYFDFGVAPVDHRAGVFSDGTGS